MPEPQFNNLPPLSPREAELVGAMLTPHASIHDIADHLDIPFAQLFDILASPAVKTHLDHIRKSLDTRLRIRLADAAHAAVDTLDEIGRSPTPHGNPNLKPTAADATIEWQTERRRAATTILRAHAMPRVRGHTKRRPASIAGLNSLIDKIEGLTDTLDASPQSDEPRPQTSAPPMADRRLPLPQLQVSPSRPARSTDANPLRRSTPATPPQQPTPPSRSAGQIAAADTHTTPNIRPP